MPDYANLQIFPRAKHVWENLDYVVDGSDDLTSPLSGVISPIDTTKPILVTPIAGTLAISGISALAGDSGDLTSIGFFVRGGAANLLYVLRLRYYATNGAMIEQEVGLRVIS